MGLKERLSVDVEVRSGKVVFGRAELASVLQHFEGEVTVIVQKRKKGVTLPMFGYYFGVVVPFVRECLRDTGTVLSKEEVHEILKCKFLCEVVMLGNEEAWRPLSLTEVDRDRVSAFIDDVKVWTYETFGLDIPEPGDQIAMELL